MPSNLTSGNNLQAIQQKVRRLTRSPSENQLSTAELNNYINTFVLYDFPEHLRTFNLRQPFTFVCNPYQDVYPTDVISFGGNTTNQLYDFQNKYITVHNPVYIAGYQSFYTQSRTQFFGIYPKIVSINSIQQFGDGSTQTFTGRIIVPTGALITPGLVVQTTTLLQHEVLFSSIDNAGIGCALQDVPVVDPNTGFNYPIGNLYDPSVLPVAPPTAVLINNNINYNTGEFTITFINPPGDNQQIFSQTVPSITSLPQALMFYDNHFTLRPVPDQPYTINFEVYVRPTILLDNASIPELQEWWQFIALGSAIKIFQDRLDMESVNLITPEFNSQMNLCQRRTLVQYSNERSATIYTESLTGGGGWWGSGWGQGNI